MRRSGIVAVLAAGLLLCGCGDLTSIEPLASEKTTVVEPLLTGNWASEGSMLIVRPEEDRAYKVVFIDADDGARTRMRCRLVRIGDSLIADVQSTSPGAFALPLHVFLRVVLKDQSLDLRFIDSKWIQTRAGAADGPAHVMVDKHPLLIGDSAGVRDFIGRYGLQEQAWDDVMHYVRLKK